MSSLWSQTLRMLSFSDANVRYVFLGMVLLGLVGGVLGSFTLLRKRALIGDALAHAALPGVGLAFLITGEKSIGILLAGAYVAGVLGVLAIIAIRKHSKIKEDAALAIVLTVFFGAGIVILTYIQKTGMGGQAGLDKFLFGQSASLLRREVVLIGSIAILLILLIVLLRKELTLLCFDPAYASSIGFPATLLDIILMGMTVGAVVIGLQAVGVVLMAAILIIPAVTARLWTHRLTPMLIIAGVTGAISGAGGSYLSFLTPRMPSGPLTVISAASIFLVSIMIVPERGIITKYVRRRKTVAKTAVDNMLRAFAEAAEFHSRPSDAAITIEELTSFRSWNRPEVARRIGTLTRQGLAVKIEKESYKLTDTGTKQAEELLRRHRLWELYLMHQADIAADHVHRDADETEHYLTPEIEKKLIQLVGAEAEQLLSPHPVEPEYDS